jgi:hypothetical protein
MPAAGTWWDQAKALLGQLAGLTALRGEQGGMIDPSGNPNAATSSPQAPTGLTSLRAAHGITIDPSGTPNAAGPAPGSAVPAQDTTFAFSH